MKKYVNQQGYFIGAFNDEVKAKELGYLEVISFPDENLFSPIWNGTQWIENATPEEIAEFNKVQVPEKIGAIPFLVQLELMGINEDAIVSKIDFLHQNGILSDQQKIEALISVKRATIFERNHPFIALIANAFGISKEQVDQIFINGNL